MYKDVFSKIREELNKQREDIKKTKESLFGITKVKKVKKEEKSTETAKDVVYNDRTVIDKENPKEEPKLKDSIKNEICDGTTFKELQERGYVLVGITKGNHVPVFVMGGNKFTNTEIEKLDEKSIIVGPSNVSIKYMLDKVLPTNYVTVSKLLLNENMIHSVSRAFNIDDRSDRGAWILHLYNKNTKEI